MSALNISDNVQDTLMYTLNAVEIFLIIASIIAFSISAYIITETPLLHFNFMRLYKCVYIEFCIFSLARMIKLIAVEARVLEAGVDDIYLTQGPLALLNAGFFGWLQIIRLCFIFCAGFCFFYIFIERILATVNLKTYETWTNNGISIFFVIFHISGAIISLIVFSTEIIPFALEIALVVFVIVLCAITILLLRKYNIRQYERSKMENTSYTLSEKFQISENIRSIEILWRSYLAAIACIIVIVCFFALTSFVENMLLKRVLFFGFNSTIAIYSIIAACIFCTSTHIWRRSLQAKLIALKKLICCSSKVSEELQRKLTIEQLDHLKTLDGQKMVFAAVEEGELYFHQLVNGWNRAKPKN